MWTQVLMLGRHKPSRSSISQALKTTQLCEELNKWPAQTWILEPTPGHCCFSASASLSVGELMMTALQGHIHLIQKPEVSAGSTVTDTTGLRSKHLGGEKSLSCRHFSCHCSLNKQHTWSLQLLDMITHPEVIESMHDDMHRLYVSMTFYVRCPWTWTLWAESPEINSSQALRY